MAVQDEIPKSRLTLTYRTEINGERENVALPLRMLVLGDLSQGTSTDRKLDLEDRKLRNIDGGNFNAIMKDMKMSIKVQVPNKIDPQNAEEIEVALPIEGMSSFSPTEIMKHVPKLKALLLLRILLQEADTHLKNKKQFAQLVQDIYSNKEAFAKVMEELKAFADFKIPTPEEKNA